MRPPLICWALIAWLAAAVASPCMAQYSDYPPWPPPVPPPPPSQYPPTPTYQYARPQDGPPMESQYQGQPPPPADDWRGPSQVLLTPGQQGSKDVTHAAEAPLHDLNVVRQTVPPVLLAALADPYAQPRPVTCAALAAEVDDLTAVLGPDFDNQPPERAKGFTESGGLGLALMHGAAASLLPFDGYLKTLSGAARHDDLIIRALGAGSARRAYLKGLGEERQCGSPAAPNRQTTPAPPLYDGPPRPDYPIEESRGSHAGDRADQ